MTDGGKGSGGGNGAGVGDGAPGGAELHVAYSDHKGHSERVPGTTGMGEEEAEALARWLSFVLPRGWRADVRREAEPVVAASASGSP